MLNPVSTASASARFDLLQTSYIGLLTHKSATLWRGDRLKAWLPSVPILTGHTITERADKTNRTDTTTHRTERRMGMGMDRTRQTHGHMDKDMDGWTVTDIQRHDRQTTDIQTSDLRQRRP